MRTVTAVSEMAQKGKRKSGKRVDGYLINNTSRPVKARKGEKNWSEPRARRHKMIARRLQESFLTPRRLGGRVLGFGWVGGLGGEGVGGGGGCLGGVFSLGGGGVVGVGWGGGSGNAYPVARRKWGGGGEGAITRSKEMGAPNPL